MKSRRSLQFAFTIVILSFALSATGGAADKGNSADKVSGPATQELLELSVGNSNIYWLLDAWGSPVLPPYWPTTEGEKRDFALKELDSLLGRAADVRANYVEDYVGWGVVEPSYGQWRWSIYQESASRIKGAGYRYIPFVWIQNLPSWARNDPSFSKAMCLEHQQRTESLSIFWPGTRGAYDRVFSNMKSAMGSMIEMVRIGAPHDFGETTYPAGLAAFAFPMSHEHDGFWAAEEDAQLHFKREMLRKYKTIGALNEAWNTKLSSFNAITPPSDNTSKRFWLDFVNWYHEALTKKMGDIIDTAKRYFPAVQFNIGASNERITLGQDISGLAKLAGQKQIYLRAPAGRFVPHLMVKRNATAVKHFGVRQFSLEVHDNSLLKSEIARYLFDCLSSGVTWNFEYPENMQREERTYQQYRSLWRSGGTYSEVDTAIFFSTTAHRINVARDSKGTFLGYPDGLVPFTEALRDLMDFDVVDERLILEDALSKYRILAWSYGGTTESSVITKIRQWIQAGGILAIDDLEQLQTVEGDPGAFADLMGKTIGASVLPVGEGHVYDAKGNLRQLEAFLSNGVRLTALERPARGLLAPLDNARDGVIMSQFAEGILLLNSTDSTVTKLLSIPAGSWGVAYKSLPASVRLSPYSIRWVDGSK